jgi:succinate-semialdehyde dehydrogenase / glutarate-semialdehyde dehydrogenase
MEATAHLRQPAGSVLDLAEGGPPVSGRMLVGGQWSEADDGATFDVTSPSTGDRVAFLPDCGPDETRRAIGAAARALPAWAALPAAERARVLIAARDLMLERREELARLLSLEEGKPIGEARGEIGYAAGFLEYFAEEGKRIGGEVMPSHATGKRVLTLRQPVGVAALITIWNFPAAGVARPLGAALAAGCTAVLKPAEQAPLSAVAMFELLAEAGLPPGAANLVTTADPEAVGRELISNHAVRKLSFTGSAGVGRGVARESAERLQHVTLELGGHAPLIVFDDADLDAAAAGAVRSKFRGGGQTCVSVNRIYVQDEVMGAFAERFCARVAGLRVGDPLSAQTDVGPLIDGDGLRKVEEHVADAVERGASLLAGGEREAVAQRDSGLYFQPTVLGDVTPEMRVMREETFGPVAPLAAFATEDEVVAAANELPWGLAAFFYTRDLARAVRVAERLEYGIIGVNDPLPAAPQLPFGGVKQSGIGKEGGRLGIEEFLDTKLVSIDIG